MIGGLQGEFGDLDIKYLKKNISKCRSHISGSFRRKPRHCAKWLRNSPGKRYQRIRLCLTGEVEMPSSPIRRQAPDVKYLDKVELRKGDYLRVQGLGTLPLDDSKRASLSRATPSWFPKRIRGALPYPDSLRETTHLLYSFQRKKNTELCSALPSHFDCIFLLAKQALRMFPQRMSG